MNTAIDVMKESVLHQTRIVATNDMHVTKKDCDYILLPVWMVNVKYKNKDYTFAMNGQTGKLVGNLPVSTKRVVGLFAAIAASLSAIGVTALLLLAH